MRKILKDITKDSLTYGMANILGKVVGFLLIPLYTAYLTPEDYGIIALLTYIYSFFTPLASFGITNAVFRRFNLHQEADEQYMALSTGSLFITCSSLLLWGIGMMVAPQLSTFLVGSPDYTFLVRVALTGALFTSLGDIFQVILRAMRLVKTLSVTVIMSLVLTISITIYLVVFRQMGVAGVIWANAIGAVFTTIVLVILCRTYLVAVFKWAELKALLNYGLPFLPYRLISQVNSFIPPFFISNYVGTAYTGLYEIALRFSLPLVFLVDAVQRSWVPIKFQIHREQTEAERRTIFNQLISVYFIFIGAICSALVLVSPEIIRVATTDIAFNGAVFLLPFLLLIKLGEGSFFMMETGFELTDNTKPMPLIALSAFVVLVGVSFALVDAIGIYSVLTAAVLAKFTQALIIRYFATKRFYVPINWQLISGILSITIGAAVVTFFIQDLSFLNRLWWMLGSSIVLLIAFVALLRNYSDLLSSRLLQQFSWVKVVKKVPFMRSK